MESINKTKELLICELNKLRHRNGELEALSVNQQHEIKRLKYLEKRSLAWLESSPVCTKVVDLDFNLQYMSSAGIKALGVDDITQFYGKPYPFSFYPDSFRNTMTENLVRVKNTGETIAQEASVIDLKGNELWFYSTIVPVNNDDGRIDYFIVVSLDITERKQIEEQLLKAKQRFRSYFDLGLIGIAITSIEKGWININDKLCEIVGYPKDELIKLTWAEITHPNDLDTDIEQFNRVLAGEIEGYTLDKRFIKKDGKVIYASISARCVRKKDGSIDYFVALIQDITARKLAEDALRREQKMEAVGQLTGGIAHDFNNILGIIIGNLSFLKDEVTDNDKVLNRVKKIDKAAQRAADLSKQLLSVSRKQETEALPTNINLLIQGMDKLITRSITPEVEVSHHFSDKLWLTDIAPGDFEDSLLNLILNARDAMSKGGQLSIETCNCLLDDTYCTQNHGFTSGEYVQLSISDTGNGISAEQQERIFEPFFTTKPEGKGTGLGLSMVFGFCKRSKGHVKVYSELGMGTTFRIYLPRSTRQEYTVDASEQYLDALPGGNEIILVVDDEQALLELAQESLQSLGYQVLTANNGKQALELLAKHQAISLLFSDVVMPGGINGYDLAEQATKNQPKLKVLLTSGYTEKASTYNAQARFNTNLLRKPYNKSSLAIEVRSLLGKYANNDPNFR